MPSQVSVGDLGGNFNTVAPSEGMKMGDLMPQSKCGINGKDIIDWWRSGKIQPAAKDFAKALGTALTVEAVNFTVDYFLNRGDVIDIDTGKTSMAP